MVKRWLAAAALMLAAGASDARTLQVGDVAPDFKLKLIDGSTVSLADLRGQVVVLNFWATWCAPCIEELPSLLALHRQMPDLAIVSIAMDTDDAVYHRFLTAHHVEITTVRDADGRINQLYGTAQIPETYIIDRNGLLRRKFVSAQNWTGPEITAYLAHLN